MKPLDILIRAAVLALCALGLTVAVFALWGVRADAQDWTITIRGTGPAPKVDTGGGGGGPIVSPPVIPPAPVVPPITDASPFVWPPQPDPKAYTDADSRYVPLCGGDPPCYAGLDIYNNPLYYSHSLACILPAGMRWRGLILEGMRLWVPTAWGTSKPATIRRLCSGGSI